MSTLLAGYQTYQCPECLSYILFETVPGTYGSHVHRPGNFAIGACKNSSCSRHGVRLKVPLTVLEVETLAPTEENPHGAPEQVHPTT